MVPSDSDESMLSHKAIVRLIGEGILSPPIKQVPPPKKQDIKWNTVWGIIFSLLALSSLFTIFKPALTPVISEEKSLPYQITMLFFSSIAAYYMFNRYKRHEIIYNYSIYPSRLNDQQKKQSDYSNELFATFAGVILIGVLYSSEKERYITIPFIAISIILVIGLWVLKLTDKNQKT